MTSRDISNPIFRPTLCQFLVGLADQDFQKRVWIDNDLRQGDFNFDMIVSFLFDDTEIAYDAHRTIRTILYDIDEAENIMLIGDAISDLLDKYGNELKDAEYIKKPEWRRVMIAATNARLIICDPTLDDQ